MSCSHNWYWSRLLICRSQKTWEFKSLTRRYAVCPGGEGAVLKTVGCKRLAGSNPVYGATLLFWRDNNRLRLTLWRNKNGKQKCI